ncbi:CBS domain-containing protein [Nocardiopsis changdeensis]|uniref:CBS domain-containing protein n=1 Tax=Nocardiopsis changdeensis TaxID=2831969 RepID=A0ABX8BF21_9ACTN|nr:MULTISPECIES: CBS domain-containing protein [Nocardiopsis]QUX20649.1 CBS domain-containing protein [Nocardiopsis changdeensis]QYX36581.1 CBS domain-containing protein [Nocardiopsis sp. MT53]
MRTVQDVMTTEVFSVTEDADYRDVASALVERRVGALPVTDAGGHVVGVVSEEDLLHKEEFAGGDYRPPVRARLRARTGAGGNAADKAEARSAGGLMTSPAITVSPDRSVVAAARSMERHGIGHLPVVDGGGHLIGIVGRRDLLSVFIREDDDIAEEARDQIAEALRPVRVQDPVVDVADGVVKLSGTVEHRSEAQAMIRRIRGVEGVVAVESDLRWRVDDIVPEYVRWRSGTP